MCNYILALGCILVLRKVLLVCCVLAVVHWFLNPLLYPGGLPYERCGDTRRKF